MEDAPRTGLAAFVLASAALAWAAGFVVWALYAPAYSSGETIPDVNPEPAVKAAIALPLLVSAVVWMALRTACRHDSRAARRLGTAVAWLLVAFSIVTGFSIGLIVLPGAVALAAAAALTPVRA
jgi:hypothetical protein